MAHGIASIASCMAHGIAGNYGIAIPIIEHYGCVCVYRVDEILHKTTKLCAPGADPGRGLWGLKPPPSNSITDTVVRYVTTGIQYRSITSIIACNATQSLRVLLHFLVDDSILFTPHNCVHKCQLNLAFPFDVSH